MVEEYQLIKYEGLTPQQWGGIFKDKSIPSTQDGFKREYRAWMASNKGEPQPFDHPEFDKITTICVNHGEVKNSTKYHLSTSPLPIDGFVNNYYFDLNDIQIMANIEGDRLEIQLKGGNITDIFPKDAIEDLIEKWMKI